MRSTNFAGRRHWIAAVTCICAAVASGGVFEHATPVRAETVRVSPIYTGQAAQQLGRSFTLQNHFGDRVASASYKGKFLLIYFGYTFCPDVCPSELQKVSEALDRLGDVSARLQPLFITLDPERDTAEVLADYISNFHESLVGLTGSPDEVQSVARSYHVLYQRVPGASETDYLLAHSSTVFLMDGDGRYAAHFAYGSTVDEIVAGVRRHME